MLIFIVIPVINTFQYLFSLVFYLPNALKNVYHMLEYQVAIVNDGRGTKIILENILFNINSKMVGQ